MNSRREKFNADTLSARREGEEAQAELVADVIHDIVGDIENFDPARLKGLGPQGFKSLVNALGADEKEGGAEPPPANHTGLPKSVRGWEDQRGAEPWRWGREVAGAILTGLALAFIAFAACALLL